MTENQLAITKYIIRLIVFSIISCFLFVALETIWINIPELIKHKLYLWTPMSLVVGIVVSTVYAKMEK